MAWQLEALQMICTGHGGCRWATVRLLLGRDESATALCCVRDPGIIHGVVEYVDVHAIMAL